LDFPGNANVGHVEGPALGCPWGLTFKRLGSGL
jgi:hypothetical protein